MENEELQRRIEELERMVDEMKEILARHTHSGNDGSDYVYSDAPSTKTEQQFKSGPAVFAGSDRLSSVGLYRGAIVTGIDEEVGDGYGNMEVIFEHQTATDGSTNMSFVYGIRNPFLVINESLFTLGGNELVTKQYNIEPNSLTGAYLNVIDPATGYTYSYQITSNTENIITINGTFTFSSKDTASIVYVPVYLGSASYPWRRVYTMDGSGGGVRFGTGAPTGENGQNGLLYSSGESLIWRSPGGSSTTIA